MSNFVTPVPHVDGTPWDIGARIDAAAEAPLRERIAELEAALDEIQGAAFALSAITMGVPIGAWENAMRALKPSQR